MIDLLKLSAEKDRQNSSMLNCKSLHRQTVTVLGAGGLGCSVAVHLAGAGVGETVLIDFDSVSAGNLNRQFFYTPENIGKPKAELAARFLSRYAPESRFVAVNEMLTDENAQSLLCGSGLVITACDNTPARLLVAKACRKLHIPMLDCGIAGGDGRVFLYIPGETACPGCIMSETDESADKRTCGAAAGVIGSFAALTALRFLSEGKHPDSGKMIIIDTVNFSVDILPVKKSGSCKICGGDSNG